LVHHPKWHRMVAMSSSVVLPPARGANGRVERACPPPPSSALTAWCRLDGDQRVVVAVLVSVHHC
jgi:hypothetical protein